MAYNDAMQYFNGNDYKSALQGFKNVTDFAPDFAPAYRLMAICHEEMGDYEQAIAYYDRVLGFDAKQADVLYNMAVLHFDNNNFSKAKASLHKALNVRPNYPKAEQLLAYISNKEPNAEAVASSLPKQASGGKTGATEQPMAVKVTNKNAAQPDGKMSGDAIPWFNRGAAYYNDKDYKNAAAAFEKALTYDEDPRILANLGRCQLHFNDLGNAFKNLKRAVALDPQNGMANFYLGKAFEQDGNSQLAERYVKYGEKYGFQDTGEQFNSVANDHFRRGGQLHKDHRQEEAIMAYQKAIDINPKVSKYYYNMGIAYHELGKAQQAVAALDKCLELDRTDLGAYMLAGNILYDAGQLESAGAYFQAAIDLGAKDGYAHHALGNVYTFLGDIRKAAQYHRESVKLNPNVAGFSFNAGISFYKLKHYPEAVEFFKQTIKTDPKHLKAYQNLFITLMELYEFDQAEKYGLEMIALHPDNAESYYLMGVMYDRKRDFKKKNEYMRLAQKLGYDIKKLPL